MSLVVTAACLVALCAAIVIWIKRTRDRNELEQHSITPDELHSLLASSQEVLVFDVRLPLDLLADSEIIPGARRIPPKEILENPSLIPKEKDSVAYCTCPGDKSSRAVIHRALTMHFYRVRFLKGGLAAWKAKGYPVEPYQQPFRLDTAT
jgi:rhodanese-related sulfurtransferase